MKLDRNRPEILTPPQHPPACCTQQTITAGPGVAPKTRQKHDYPSAAWRISYQRRTAAERLNAAIKDTAVNGIDRGWIRLTGITPLMLWLPASWSRATSASWPPARPASATHPAPPAASSPAPASAAVNPRRCSRDHLTRREPSVTAPPLRPHPQRGYTAPASRPGDASPAQRPRESQKKTSHPTSNRNQGSVSSKCQTQM